MSGRKDAFDVVVLGAGVVGAAIARALSAFELRTALVEAGPDVGAGTSKANTAILHTGFDAEPGTLEARLVRRGYELMKEYARETGIPVEATGACLVAWNGEEAASLLELEEKARSNGVLDLERLSPEDLYRLEPRLAIGAWTGLRIPGESIICPYTPVLAFARQAIANGVELFLESRFSGAVQEDGVHVMVCGKQTLRSRWVVNAAGLNSDVVDRAFGHNRFTVTPRRGELIVFDKLARGLLSHILLPVPSKATKGVLVSPTVFGNVLLGPTAEDLEDKEETATSADGLRRLMEKGRRILPALVEEEVTATYAGLRAATQGRDYQVHIDPPQGYVCVGGIRSTGLTASLGLAEHVVGLLAKAGLQPRRKAEFKAVRAPQRPGESAERIAADPEYGRVVCHCERVTRGELRDAARGALPARSLDGLRRRTRCLQGRCQGFYCFANVVADFSADSGVKAESLLALEG